MPWLAMVEGLAASPPCSLCSLRHSSAGLQKGKEKCALIPFTAHHSLLCTRLVINAELIGLALSAYSLHH